MSWLFEDPTTLIAAGLLIEVLLGVGLVKSGRGVLVLPMIGVLALVGLGVLVERLVVTDREQVETALDGVCRALMANDVEGVVSYIDPEAAVIRSHVRSLLPRAHVTDARLYDLDIRVNPRTSPPSAQANFTGRVKGNFQGEGGGSEGLVLRKFTVDLRQEGEKWLITGYEDHGTLGGHRDD
ncbi:MAG TPA: hypothetical protein VG826_15205 [Pirellulales bacterium]|nr:hypothetical protein [Pirellulales bacterium]